MGQNALRNRIMSEEQENAIKSRESSKKEEKVADSQSLAKEHDKGEKKQNSKIDTPEISLWKDVIFTFPRPRVKFGRGVLTHLPDAIEELLLYLSIKNGKKPLESSKILIIIGGTSFKESGKLDELIKTCEEHSLEFEIYSCGTGEPTTDGVNEAVKYAKTVEPQFIVGIGGGAVIDLAKAISGIYTNGGKVEEYHEGKEFIKASLPFIAVPTTAGTGSEITDNAVITDLNKGFKKSIRGSSLIAKYILLDPTLTITCPPEITANSGADALVQAIEAFVSKNSHPLSDIYALNAIKLIAPNLKKVYINGSDYDARAQMQLGAYFGGVAFSNVKLGLVHGLAHPIGFKYSIPHGLVCGTLLPWVIEYNNEIISKKYAIIAKTLDSIDLFLKYEPKASSEDNTRRLIGMIKELFYEVGIPLRLKDLGVKDKDIDWIIENTKGGSVEANPRSPDPKSLKQLLQKAL